MALRRDPWRILQRRPLPVRLAKFALEPPLSLGSASDSFYFRYRSGQVSGAVDAVPLFSSSAQLSFQSKVVAPTEEYIKEWDPEWIGSLRSTMWLLFPVIPRLSISLVNIFSLHLYRHPSYYGYYGESANPAFSEKVRWYFEYEIIPSRLKFVLPIHFRLGHYHTVPDARNSGRSKTSVWAAPYVMYTFEKGVNLSLEYESDTFCNSRFTEFYFGESLKSYTTTIYLGIPI